MLLTWIRGRCTIDDQLMDGCSRSKRLLKSAGDPVRGRTMTGQDAVISADEFHKNVL